MRSSHTAPRIERSRPRIRELGSEALAGLVQRPARTLLTMLGTILGVGAFVAILGLTSTAGGQISAAFSVLAATQVDVVDAGDSASAQANRSNTLYDFPADADARIERLNGTVHAGVWWQVAGSGSSPVTVAANPSASSSSGSSSTPIDAYAATPEALAAMGPTIKTGRLYDGFAQKRG